MSISKSKVIHGQCGTASQKIIDRSKYHQDRVVDYLVSQSESGDCVHFLNRDSPLSLLNDDINDDAWRHLGEQRVDTLPQGIAPDAIVTAEKAMPLPEGSKCHLYTCQSGDLNKSTTNGCGCSQSVARPQKATFDEIHRGFLHFSRLDLSDARELTAGPALLVTGPELEKDRTLYTRNHPLYLETRMRSDGLYVCPWNGRPDCSHLATSSFEASRSYIDDHLAEVQMPRA